MPIECDQRSSLTSTNHGLNRARAAGGKSVRGLADARQLGVLMNGAIRIGIAIAFVAASAQLSRSQSVTLADERPITISGCVERGTKADTFLIKNVSLVEGTPPAGTSPNQLYLRLDTTRGLKDHVGHRVDIHGIADFGDIDSGTLEVIKQSDGTVAVSLTSERETVTADLSPTDATAAAAPVGTSGRAEVPTYQLNVESIRMVAPTCSGGSSR